MRISIILLLVATLSATQYNAASGSYSDVLSAYNSASDGDTVNIPADTVSWSSQLLISDKEITILGASQLTTVITYTGSNSYDAGAFRIDNDAGDPKDDFEIGDITIIEGMGNRDTGAMGINHWDSGPDWVVHHVTFKSGYNGNMMNVGRNQGSNGGLIDSCLFELTASTSTKALQINAKDMDVETYDDTTNGYGSVSWGEANTLGTKNCTYIEDCTFDFSSGNYVSMDFDEGARVVVRYCTFTNTGIGSHGDDGGSLDRGVRHYEIYNNTFTRTTYSFGNSIDLRGGMGCIYENSFADDVQLIHYCSCDPTVTCGEDWVPPCEPGEYPCQGQIGRGEDQALDPLYFWNNTWNGNGIIRYCDEDVAGVIDLNRDYYTDDSSPYTTKPDYTAYTYPHPLATAGAGEEEPESHIIGERRRVVF